ncbi:LysR family transcriptional regulator [Photobacterium aquae]|uniref:LysR family transcriptional regulator n=1 Tax=Photobacterium aquae TaxID=1195763 RepID=A0A0J1HDB8_9GAMM|nr:LysR family transcriptional regulator [Photobacterium aquae]KLV09628.1 LysR family transcriptional regulator [Photobacterium aquae]
MHNMEWDSIRVFLAVAEEGSMSAAALALGMSQPTVSRQIVALEQKVGFNLFDRSSHGLKLTDNGEILLETARQAAKGVEGFKQQVVACKNSHEGHVRLAVGEIAAFYFLPDALTAFREAHPEIDVELLVENKAVNLNKREADLLISREKPTQPDLVVSYLHEEALGFYAHRDYLAEMGTPADMDAMHHEGYHLIGYDQFDFYTRAASEIGGKVTKSNFCFRTDSYKMQVELARAKAGIAVMFDCVARRYPELVPVLPGTPLPKTIWWLVSHHDVRVNRRIQCLMTFLRAWFHRC